MHGTGKKPYQMLSIPDMAILGAAALMLFGPDQLPKVLRKVGQVTREIQNTSQSFIREMERAAEIDEPAKPLQDAPVYPYEPAPYDATPPYEAPAYDVTPPSVEHPDLPEPDPAPPVGEKLAEPRPALELQARSDREWPQAAQTPPEGDHPAHV